MQTQHYKDLPQHLCVQVIDKRLLQST